MKLAGASSRGITSPPPGVTLVAAMREVAAMKNAILASRANY